MQTSSQLRHPAPHSRLKEKDWEIKTLETVSPQFYELSEEANPNFSVSKTCLDCYQPLLIPETNPAHISNRCSGSFTQVGTMRNGLLSEHNSLRLSGEVKGSYSLPRPGALSKSSPACRPPGNTKSEAQAKKLGILQKNEVFNPEWLEQQFGLPIGWTSPQELKAATELIAPVVPPLEISSTPELPKLHSSESCTSIPFANSDEIYEDELICDQSKIVLPSPSWVAVCTSHSPRGSTLSTLTHMNIILHEANGLQIGQRHEDGYINLTKMAQASEKKLNDYLRLDATKDFIDELSMDTGIPVSKLIEIRRGKPAYLQGTWAHPQVAVNCGQWCSAAFAVLVSKWVIDWLAIASNPIELTQALVIQAYIESSQVLNRLIHTAIHQQTDSLRFALEALDIDSSSVLEIDPFVAIAPANHRFTAYSPEEDSPKSKTNDCWYTPPHIIELVLQVLGQIDLDPCADDGKHILARSHFTDDDDGLNRKWHGCVFMNPPYSCPGVWMKKLQAEVESGRVIEAIALVPAATDTNWLSPVLKQQPVCFWKGRIKFLDADYKPKLAARQSHVLLYWGENWEKFREVFDEYGYIPPMPATQPLLGDEENSPSKVDLSPSKRQRGFGNGCIHWRTITKNGKDYPQAYYHWKENGKKRTKYIPKQLLGLVEEAEKQKRPVIEILELLGIGSSPSNLLGDEKNSPSNDDNLDNLLGDKQVNHAESFEITTFVGSPSNSPSNEISPSKRRKGDGSGSIHWRTITRGAKDYSQAYYHYEFWSGGDRLTKSSRYIPKKLLAQVQQLDVEKAPVREILGVLGVMV